MSSTNGEGERSLFDGPLTSNQDFDMGFRLGIASELGHSGFDDRDRYDVFGWEPDPDEDEYLGLYLRNAYARAVVDRPATATWRHTPDVGGGDAGGDSQFEKAVEKLERNHDLSSYAERVDRLAGVGEYALLFFDFDDVDDLEGLAEPYEPSDADLDSIRGLRVYAQAQVDDVEYGDFGTDRWGEPVSFDLDLSQDIDDDSDDGTQTASVTIHHSRLVVVPSTQLLDDENKSRPRLEPVLNQLYDIEKTLGAAAEAAYSSANSDLWLNANPNEVDMDQGSDDIRDELMRFYHQGQPYLRTQGMDVEQLAGEIQDPSGLIEAELSAISAETGIPKRVLSGDAAGELSASQEDTRRWYSRIRERQQQYAGPHIYRPALSLLDEHGIIPSPTEPPFGIDWPELFEPTEAEIAEREQARSQVAANLGQVAPGFARRLASAEYIGEGEIPDPGDTDQAPPGPSASDAQRDAFRQDFLGKGDHGLGANATRFSEGDVVMTPQGLGVVAEVRTEAFEGTDGDGVSASTSSPTYVVGLKDGRIGVGFYSASELEERKGALENVGPENPTADVTQTASANSFLERIGLGVTANDWSMPESWRDSDTPARVILLKAWAEMGGQFDCGGACCMGELHSERLCASLKDEVLGGWEGWRRGG